MTLREILRATSMYPIPEATVQAICGCRGLDADAELEEVGAAGYLAKADALLWLSQAPNVSQGGVTYSFSEYERKMFREQAEALYTQNGEKKVRFGYKGARL